MSTLRRGLVAAVLAARASSAHAADGDPQEAPHATPPAAPAAASPAAIAPAPPAAPPSGGPAARAIAARGAPLVTWLCEMGFDVGLNTLYTVESTNGTDTTHANSGIYISAGGAFLPLLDDRLRTLATIGVKYIGQSFSNGDINYYSFPLEVVETVQIRWMRLGAGLHMPLASRVSGTGAASDLTERFDNSPGMVLRAEFSDGNLGLGVRYVRSRLAASGTSVDGPAFGLLLSFSGGIRW